MPKQERYAALPSGSEDPCCPCPEFHVGDDLLISEEDDCCYLTRKDAAKSARKHAFNCTMFVCRLNPESSVTITRYISLLFCCFLPAKYIASTPSCLEFSLFRAVTCPAFCCCSYCALAKEKVTPDAFMKIGICGTCDEDTLDKFSKEGIEAAYSFPTTQQMF